MQITRLTALLAAGPVLVASVALAATEAVAVPASCASMGGAADNGVCRIAVTDAAYQMDIRYPLDYPDEQAIADYVNQARAGFVTLAQTPGSLNLPYEMDVTAESFRSRQTQSVVLTLFQNVGSAHPTTWYKSFTYDTAGGSPVSFDQLFAPGTQPLKTIFPMVAERLEQQTGLAGAVSTGDGMDPAHYQNFAITDDSLIFFFGRAEMLPSYAGESSVALPRDALPPLQV